MKSLVCKWWYIVPLIVVIMTPAWTATVTPVEQCQGESFDNLQDRIQVIPCDKTRCKLQQNSNITVVFKFAPTKEVKTLTNNVYAVITGIPFPFLGVSGNSACDDVTHAGTGEPASCPLAAGQEYMYTNVFPVLPVYPAVSMRVHWSLNDGQDTVICFEVPAIITRGARRNSHT